MNNGRTGMAFKNEKAVGGKERLWSLPGQKKWQLNYYSDITTHQQQDTQE